MQRPILFILLLFLTTGLAGQRQTLAERLGYAPDARLLIIHADDLALSHSENQASFDALDNGVVNSASVMAPCPWLAEVAAYARQHPGHDLGMHLTLTSEWRDFKWGPVAGAGTVPSLVDSAGYFHADCGDMARRAKANEVEIELRAQIERARSLGLEPTHLDSHMGCLFSQRADLFEIYLKLGREYGIPAMVTDLRTGGTPEMRAMITERDLPIDRVLTAGPSDFTAGMEQYYVRTLRELPAGVSVLLIHCALDNHEMKGVTVAHPHWGSQWRQADYDFFTSDRARLLLQEENIQLVTWRQIGALLQQQQARSKK